MIRRLLNGWFDGGVRSENRNTIRAMRFSEGVTIIRQATPFRCGRPERPWKGSSSVQQGLENSGSRIGFAISKHATPAGPASEVLPIL
jgi:hypothetical protein